MKIKSIITEEDKKYYDSIRNNPNIKSTHTKIAPGAEYPDKKDYAASVVFALMSINGYVNKATSICSDKNNSLKIIDTMIDLAKKEIENYHLKSGSKDYQINNIITFDKKEYLVLDVISKNNISYLYLANYDELEDDDNAIVKVENNKYFHIEDNEEFNFVLNKIFIDFKDDIINLLAEE